MTGNEVRIGVIAREANVSVDTIRHYERKGLLGDIERDGSGYRRYSSDVIRRVLIVRRALTIGFTLDELSKFFRQRASGSPPCRTVRALAQEKLSDIDQRIAALDAMRASLMRVLETWDRKLAQTPPGGFAFLFEDLL